MEQFVKLWRFIITTKAIIDKDSEILCNHYRQQFLIIGREIERVSMLRYLKTQLSEPKWNQLAKHYNFDTLNDKYPHNPLLDQPHGKATPKSFSV